MVNDYSRNKCKELVNKTTDPENMLWQMVNMKHPRAYAIKFELERKDIIWREMYDPKGFADQMISSMERAIETETAYDQMLTIYWKLLMAICRFNVTEPEMPNEVVDAYIDQACTLYNKMNDAWNLQMMKD